MKQRYISSEYELPLVHEEILAPASQEFITTLWEKLAQTGWELCNGGVKKQCTNPEVVNPDVFITTDTGPTIEFAPTPRTSLHEIEDQRKGLMREILDALTGTPYSPVWWWPFGKRCWQNTQCTLFFTSRIYRSIRHESNPRLLCF